MATHSSILSWRIPWTEELGGLHAVSPWSHKESDMTERPTLMSGFRVIALYSQNFTSTVTVCFEFKFINLFCFLCREDPLAFAQELVW